MNDPPLPSEVPPGWYPDPSGQPGYRWWDGYAWTEAVTGAVGPATAEVGPVADDNPGPFEAVGPWLSESFRLCISRAGHFLPMIVLFVVSIMVPMSVAAWYGLRDTVLTYDSEEAVLDVSFGGSSTWLGVVVGLLPIWAGLMFLCKAAAVRQAWAVQAERPEAWSVSVQSAVARSRRILPAGFGRLAGYVALNGLFLAGVVLSPVLALTFPLVVFGLFLIWTRFSMVGTVAALGGPDDKPFPVSWSLTGVRFLPLLGRLMLLAFLAGNMVLVAGLIGTPFQAIAGASSEPVQSTSEVIVLNDWLGPNPSTFALGALFSALGIGANYVMAAVGTALLYRRLGGPSQVDEDETDGLASGDDLPPGTGRYP